MRTLKLTVAYDGTRFVGWQRQANGDSVQGVLEDALARFEGGPVTVHGAGRTDAGVHALGQVASVTLTAGHDTNTLHRALNAQLPVDVRVLAVEEAAADFHARFRARAKTYRYLLRVGPFAPPFERAFVWHVPQRLDLEAMREGARLLLGAHDFAAFQSVGTQPSDTVRTIVRSEVREEQAGSLSPIPDGSSSILLAYQVTGNGFLRHMVRAIVGTLVEMGRGWREPGSMTALLRDRSRGDAGATAPPQGLFLVGVDYD